MRFENNTYRTWSAFEKEQRQRYSTFQLSLDELEKDLYSDQESYTEPLENEELNFDY